MNIMIADYDHDAAYDALAGRIFGARPGLPLAVITGPGPGRPGAAGGGGVPVPLISFVKIREAAPRLRLVGAFPPRKHTTVAFTP
jgi:hypothetical protein